MKHLGDITKIDGTKIEPVHVITAGSPCQDLSIAGNRAGLSGERSGLFMEFVRIIKEMREATNGEYPAFAVWENVPGAFSSNKGEDFRCVLEELAKICQPDVLIPQPPKGKWRTAGAIVGDGWSIAWRVLDAQFWGVPQRRRRIALVFDIRGESAPQILFEYEGLRGNTAAGSKAGQRAADDSQKCADGAIAMRIRGGCEGGGKGPLLQVEKSGTLATGNDQTIFVKPTSAFMAGQGAKAHGVAHMEECAPTLKGGHSGLNQVPSVAYTQKAFGQYEEGVGTLTTSSGAGSTGETLAVAVDCRNHTANEVSATLQAKANGGQSLNYINPVLTYDARGNGEGG